MDTLDVLFLLCIIRYTTMAAVFAQHVSEDTALLRTSVENNAWVSAQKITHKLRGTFSCFYLDCAKSADALDAALQLQIVAIGKVSKPTDGGEDVKALCATFLVEVDAIVSFFTWERAAAKARQSTKRRACSESPVGARRSLGAVVPSFPSGV